MRGQDHVGRWGGEEFLLLLPETDLEGARVLAEKLRARVAATPIPWQGHALTVTLTAAVAPFDRGGSFTRTLSRVDHALLLGKRDGKNRVVLVSPALAPHDARVHTPAGT